MNCLGSTQGVVCGWSREEEGAHPRDISDDPSRTMRSRFRTTPSSHTSGKAERRVTESGDVSEEEAPAFSPFPPFPSFPSRRAERAKDEEEDAEEEEEEEDEEEEVETAKERYKRHGNIARL